ncbi:MAG: stringent starvation protein [Proteobacteria bacterium]|nr:stringent starvation protein [Pseudomonadota bacterium]
MSQVQATSTKPYLIRALHEWCVDNSFTPYIVVQVNERTRVPMQHVRAGQIVLNIAPYATGGLQISNEEITCQARFNGVAQSLYVPISQVLAIYARETGQGMAFEQGALAGSGMELGGVVAGEDLSGSAEPGSSAPEAPSDPEPPAAPSPKGGHLRRIK